MPPASSGRSSRLWRSPFTSLFWVPLIAPIIVLYNPVYVPVVRHIFPGTFLIGLLMMSLMMCFGQLILEEKQPLVLWLRVLPVL